MSYFFLYAKQWIKFILMVTILFGASSCNNTPLPKSRMPNPYGDSGKTISIDISSPVPLAESTLSGTLISGYSKDNKLLFSAGFPLFWNSFSANSLGELQLFVRSPNMDSPFVASPEAVEGAHSTYLVKNNDELYLFNSSSSDPDGYYYPMKEIDNGKYMFEKWTLQVSREPFKNLGYQYSLDKTDAGQWMLSACKVTNSKECSEIEIAPDSAVFSYGGNNVNTVAVTNKADVLFHSKNGWCRGEKTTNGGYKCNKEMTAITAHGGWQIYSSIKTKDGTLMGEFPTGRFWLLGDGVLHPTSLSPYNKDSHENLELQSVALFCGDLYAGFWPRGEVWEKPLDSNQWKEPQRLFTSPLGLKKGEIPYKDLLESRAYGVYDTNTMFGQRATSMATYGNSLLVATGNLGNWHKDVKRPWFMSKSQADEYGKIHIKTDSNCLTTFVDDKVRLNIQINSNTLSVYNDGYKIAETLLHDFDSSKITHFKIGEGVFGPLSDKQIKVNILNNSI